MLVGRCGLMAATLPPSPDGTPGTTNGPEGPLVDETAPTVSGRPRCCLQAYAVKARSPRGRCWPRLRVPTRRAGKWAFSAGGAWEKGRLFSWWFTRSSRPAHLDPRCLDPGASAAGSRAGYARPRRRVRASVRPAVRAAMRPAPRQRGATRERSNFTALTLPHHPLRVLNSRWLRGSLRPSGRGSCPPPGQPTRRAPRPLHRGRSARSDAAKLSRRSASIEGSAWSPPSAARAQG